MMDWSGTPEEVQAAIGEIEAGTVSYKELREFAGLLKIKIPINISKPDLAARLLDFLRNRPPADAGATSSPASAPEPDPSPGRDPAPSIRPAELVLDEDLDVVAVFFKGESRPALSRRLGGARGQAAMKTVRKVEELAAAEGYVVRRQLRRVGGADYGL